MGFGAAVNHHSVAASMFSCLCCKSFVVNCQYASSSFTVVL